MRYMTTTKTRPVSVMDQLLDSMLYEAPVVRSNWKSFAVDILENENQYLVSAELPGFAESEVEVTLNDNLMVLSAVKAVDPSVNSGTETTGTEKAEDDKDVVEAKTEVGELNKVHYLIKERSQSQYKRSFTLPKDADRESIKAVLKDGVLNLTIGKKPEAKPLTIKIN